MQIRLATDRALLLMESLVIEISCVLGGYKAK